MQQVLSGDKNGSQISFCLLTLAHGDILKNDYSCMYYYRNSSTTYYLYLSASVDSIAHLMVLEEKQVILLLASTTIYLYRDVSRQNGITTLSG